MKANQNTSSVYGAMAFFMLGSVYFIAIKFLGFSGPLMPSLDLPCDFTEATLKIMSGGAIGGMLVGVIEFFISPNHFKGMRFELFLLIKVLLYAMIIGVSTLLVNIWLSVLLFGSDTVDAIRNAVQFLGTQGFASIFIHFGLLSIIYNFYRQAKDRFGQRVLLNYLMGRYHQPFEEERIFMFLDLKSSTRLAEQLGHAQFSRLLQCVFEDLSFYVLKYKADVYQYVGDEAVLTWAAQEGLANANCLRVFFDFEQHLQAKAQQYLDEFGVVPEFKASLNIGLVTVTEVGGVRKEIAYHGDVLNTAARIQDLCNRYNKKLLISEYLEVYIKSVGSFRREFINSIVLRGKEQPLNIYTVSPY